uniref:Link domain-containing protein n=1 Tax=Amazona collaria TaxID=241587 RepID=A0A8B9FSC7_9PSIT
MGKMVINSPGLSLLFLLPAKLSVNTCSILSPCRIRGVGIYLEEKVNFSEASNACNQLNLQLASRDQVENALKHGFETCRYMTFFNGLVVIPRITSNKKCGKGNVGLVPYIQLQSIISYQSLDLVNDF